MSISVQIKRAYEAADDADGLRVLVDRLWPRGLSKDKLKHDLWLKELGPSNALRHRFGHEASRWDDFVRDYRVELDTDATRARLQQILDAADGRPITLVYGARDTEHNQAVVLAQELQAYAAQHAGG